MPSGVFQTRVSGEAPPVSLVASVVQSASVFLGFLAAAGSGARSGAGGGGYVIFVAEQPIKNAVRVNIRREMD